MTKEDILFSQIVQESFSIAEVLRKLGRAYVGSNYKYVKQEVARLNLDAAHWKSYGLVRNIKHSLSDLLTEHSHHKLTKEHKKKIVEARLLTHVCAICDLLPEWNNAPLVLRLDHINGIRDDNRIENLRFLCPNCDSQTSTFCGRNKRNKNPRRPQQICPECGNPMARSSTRCKGCASQFREPQKTKIHWPSTEELTRRLKETSVLALAKELGVSDNALRKRMLNHPILHLPGIP